jgi:hypothetical protein
MLDASTQRACRKCPPETHLKHPQPDDSMLKTATRGNEPSCGAAARFGAALCEMQARRTVAARRAAHPRHREAHAAELDQTKGAKLHGQEYAVLVVALH